MAGRRSATYDLELTCALTAARAAGERLKTEFHRGFPLEVDRELDVLIREQLTASFPRYGYLGEEVGFTSPQDEVHMWVVDPQDGTSAAKRGFRGAAVSIALMRNGVPVLGVVHAYCAPDDSGDTFWWAEHLTGVVRNGREMVRTWPTAPSTEGTALVSQDADWNATANARMVAPLRFRTIPGIAYRLALVAAGEADVAITLNAPTSWDVAGGHALLLGAGGDLFSANGSPVKYADTGAIRGGGSAAFFGGTKRLVEPLIARPWNTVLNKATADKAAERLCFLLPGKTLDDAEMLSRAQGCLLGQFAGDSLGSLVEFQSAESIAKRYPEGPKWLEDGGTWDTIAGQPTDDSEMALALARSLVEADEYDADRVAEAYARWYESAPYDMGSTTTQALSKASAARKAGAGRPWPRIALRIATPRRMAR